MSRLYIPTEEKIKGPWLISQRDLENLDKRLDLIQKKLYIASLNNMQLKPEEDLLNEAVIEKKIIISSNNKSKLTDNSLLDVLKDQKLTNLNPFKLEIEIGKKYSEFVFLLSVSNKNEGILEYAVECIDEKTKDEIKYEIDNWIEEIKPSKLKQFWSNYLSSSLILIGIIYFMILFGNLFESPKSTYKEILKIKADSLINNGITNNNQNQAIDLILKLQSEYIPAKINEKRNIQPKILKLLIISTLCFFVLFIAPKTTIGLGKNKQKLKFYKFWVKFVFIFIPSVIIIPFLFNLFYDWIVK